MATIDATISADSADDYLRRLAQFSNGSEKKWVPPWGSTTPKLMLILGYPSADACEEEDLEAGASMAEVINALEVAEIPKEDVYVTTMVKFGIGTQSKPNTAQIELCREALDFEIATLKPRLIMTLGADSFKRIVKVNRKVTDALGEIVDCPYGCKLIPNYSPGMILTQDPTLRPFFRGVFDDASKFLNDRLQYTQFEWLVVDDPEVNQLIVADYIQRGMLTVGYDAEWLGTKKTDNEVMYTFQYSCEPHKAVVLSLTQDGIAENRALLDTMKPLLEHPQAVRLGWNIRADDSRLMLRGFNIPDETLGFDGMKAVAFIDSRFSKGLETGIKKFTTYKPYYTRLNQTLADLKIPKHEMSRLKLLQPEVFYEYCAGDAVSHRTACLAMKERMEATLPQKQLDYFFQTYLPLSHYFLDLELAGIPIDLTCMEDLTRKYSAKYQELRGVLQAAVCRYGFDSTVLGDEDPREASKRGIYEDLNPNSAPQKKILLFDKLKLIPAYYTKAGKSPKPRVWYDKQKPQTQRQYSPSTNGNSLTKQQCFVSIR